MNKLYSLPRNLGQAKNFPLYFWKNLFGRVIYRSHPSDLLKGLGLTWNQENSDHQEQLYSLLSYHPDLYFCTPSKAIILGRSILLLWSFSLYTNMKLFLRLLIWINIKLHCIDLDIPFDLRIIVSHTSYFTVTWSKLFSLQWIV